MKLTQENKAHIDSLSYESLLSNWRYAPVGYPWFQGETGEYWKKRMQDLREQGVDHVTASKNVGWEGRDRC